MNGLKSCHGLQVDRFIPARNAFDVDLASFKMLKENDGVASPTASTPSKVILPLVTVDGKECSWHLQLGRPDP